MGGVERLRAKGRITIDYRSTGHRVGQNYAFDLSPKIVPIAQSRTAIDYTGGLYFGEGESKSPGGYTFRFRTVVTPKQSFSIDVLRNRNGNIFNRLSLPQQQINRRNSLLEAPHLLLLQMLDRPESLRWLGDAEIEGRAYRAISYATEDAVQISLYFDTRTKLPARYELLGSHPLLGDTVTFGSYSAYETIGGVLIPRRRVVMSGGNIISDAEYTQVTLDFAADAGLLEVPAGYVEASNQTNTSAEPVRKLGDGVYLIERGLPTNYRVMFVVFDGYVMVLEAPQNAAVSQAVIALVKKTAPGKPIRYVSFSHFHFDHTGGLRQYIAEGATVVTPNGNQPFVEAIAKSRFTLRPDALALSPRQPIIETLQSKRVFTDGKRTVEFHSIGPTSHVAHMTIFYFPKEKILFQGDMFSPLESGGIAPIIEINHELLKKVDALKLDVETLIGVHSGGVAWKDFRKAVADASKDEPKTK